MTPAKASFFRPERVLCAVDLSSMSAEVLQWALLFAATFRSQLEVVHADYSDYPAYLLPSQAQQLAAETEKRREVLQRNLSTLVYDVLGAFPSSEIAVLEGHPAEALLSRIASTAPDLVVIGSHGHGGFNRLRFGSVAEQLIRTTRTPTLVARTRANRQIPKIARVLCPVTFDATAHRSLQAAASIAQAFGAQLTIVHVADQTHLDLDAKHRELCQWVPADIRNKCSVVESVRRGNPPEQILLATREQPTDLIVLGTQPRPFLELAILGTTAERVLRHAEETVLVIPSEVEVST
jgi:nucleotide-binding universal stress UspA family protein